MTMKNAERERIFVDTNVLIRANVLTAPLHTQALAMLKDLTNSNAERWINR